MNPPGQQPEFADLCTDCGDCIEACPEGIVLRHAGGGPVVDLSRGACTFCGACARACGTGALVETDPLPWPWSAVIAETCLSRNGVSCRACEDACEARAIRFRLMTAGRAMPVLDAATCTGCGACAHACPTGAVTFERYPLAEALT